MPGWVVTYGDMMSLLLTFFVLLLSFSTVSEEDFKEAMMSLQGALGVLQANKFVVNPVPQPTRRSEGETERLARELRRRLQVTGRAEMVQIDYDATGGIRLTLPDAVLFDPASADLKPAAAPILQEIATLLADLPAAFIEVRGHTDSSPLISSPRYRDNHELSYWRADAVARRLAAQGGAPMSQIEVVACGDGQPVAPNDTEAGRGANRRVDIHIRGIVERDRERLIGERFGTRGAIVQQPETTGVDFSILERR
ncbi:MAG TPA: flagellar motor protein MotB [Candidatus Hydrogenedentes bacterium]|nr:flagellar motor protein MotB [Candidatus Hydrogenedentota bacterium]